MSDKLKPKDAKAKKRYDDEVKLRHDIAELLKEFSKKSANVEKNMEDL